MDTVGSLIDKLTIENIRIWHAEDIKRRPDATDEEIAKACRITNICNQKRNDLVDEINEMLGQKQYRDGTTKLYGK